MDRRACRLDVEAANFGEYVTDDLGAVAGADKQLRRRVGDVAITGDDNMGIEARPGNGSGVVKNLTMLATIGTAGKQNDLGP